GFVAIAMVFLSPQMVKFTGHYALGHLWVFPLVVLLCHQFIQRPGWALATIQAGLILFVGFLHPYLLLISACIVLVIYIFSFSFEKILEDRVNRRKIFWAVGQTIVPVLIFFVAVKLMDDVSDRPSDPYGFLLYRAPFFSMVFPVG